MSSPGTLAFCGRLLRRQLVLAVRRPIEIGNPLLFFAMVVALFPLGLGPAPDKLADFAPGILWIIALLSNLLTSDGVFRSDFDDGSLEQLMLSPQPLYMSVLSYVTAHWLITGLLLALVSPVFALMLNLPTEAIATLFLSLLLGTALLSLLGAIGAALGMAITWLVSDALLDSVSPILALSMGASAVILFTMPTAPAAQPVPVILAHCVAAFLGVLSAQTFNNTALAVGVAVGVHAGLMVRFGYMHPPSGGTALTAIIGGSAVTDLGYSFIWRPVLLNAVLLVVLAFVINAPFAWRRYPAKP